MSAFCGTRKLAAYSPFQPDSLGSQAWTRSMDAEAGRLARTLGGKNSARILVSSATRTWRDRIRHAGIPRKVLIEP